MDNIDNIAYLALLSMLFFSIISQSEIIGGLALIFSFLIIFKKIIKENFSFGFENYKKAVFVYFLLVTLSLAASTLFKLSLHGYIKTCIYVLFFFCACDFFKFNKNKIIPTILFVTFLMSYESLIAIFQNSIGVNEISGWQDMSNINPEEIISRSYGTLKPYNPNLLAGYLLCGLGGFIFTILYFINKQKKRISLVFGILFLINIIAIMDTGSRGAYIGFILFFLCLFSVLIYYIHKKTGGLSKIKKRYKNITLVSIIGILYFIITDPALIRRFESIFAFRADSSISFRFNVYEAVWRMFLDNPFLGIGVGNQNFREIYGLYMKTGFDALGSYCVFLEIAVESGIFALLAFVLFLYFVIRTCIKIGFYDFDKTNKILALSIVLMILAVMGHGLFDTIWFRPQVQLLFWTNIAMLDGLNIKLCKINK